MREQLPVMMKLEGKLFWVTPVAKSNHSFYCELSASFPDGVTEHFEVVKPEDSSDMARAEEAVWRIHQIYYSEDGEPALIELIFLAEKGQK